MPGEIVIIGENRSAHVCLSQNYDLLQLKDVPEAIPYLRDPDCAAKVALFCNVTMRREQDFAVLSEISAIHPYLQILLLPENARSLPSNLPLRNGNIRMIQKSASTDGLVRNVRQAVNTATILVEKAKQEERKLDSEDSFGGS